MDPFLITLFLPNWLYFLFGAKSQITTLKYKGRAISLQKHMLVK